MRLKGEVCESKIVMGRATVLLLETKYGLVSCLMWEARELELGAKVKLKGHFRERAGHEEFLIKTIKVVS